MQKLAANLKEQGLADPVRAFVGNLNAVGRLTELSRVFYLAGAQMYVNLIRFNVEKKGLVPPQCYVERQLPRFSEEFYRYLREQRQTVLAIASLEEAIEQASGSLEYCYSLMSSQITLGWTAFEVLAGDLWEAALNIHPKTLANRASQSNQEKSSVSFDQLGAYGFDVRNVMGTLLRDTNKKNPFQRLESIGATYEATFPKGPVVSKKDFWQNKDILAVSLLRNVIVHRAGIPDDEFITRSKSDARLSVFEKGKLIRLDGALVTELLLGLLSFSMELVRSVDGWISANKD